MLEKYSVRTDLALEEKERFESDNVEISGVVLEEEYDKEREIRITRVKVETENGAKTMGKPVGVYLTMEAPNMAVPDEDYHREVSVKLSEYIEELIRGRSLDTDDLSVLVVGLGNRQVTPDALGPYVADNLVNGVVDETKPDLVIAIDALAARNTRRLNRTIQIADTGIHPGSGVGNHRNGLTKESVGVPVIGIGVPTVVDAATIANDTMENLIEALETSEILKGVGDVLRTYNSAEKYELVKELISPHLNGMFVTPKDEDELVKQISYTISEALNMLFTNKEEE